MPESSWLSSLINDLTRILFQAEEKRLAKRELELVRENAKLGGAQDGFLYQGLVYSDLDPKLRSKGQKGNLHPSLQPAMDFHLKDKAGVAFDKHQVGQALFLVLKGCRSFQDVRDALPNCLKDHIEPCRNLDRTRPEGYTVAGDPRAARQYQKLREKIEFYNAAKLLY